ncbi:C-X-C chemokine receptor type 2-like [Arapaima gigas]
MSEPNDTIFTGIYMEDFDYFMNLSAGPNSTFVLDPNTLVCEPFATEVPVSILVCVFCMVVTLLAAPGNVLVSLVLCSSKHTLLPSDVYLLHLAVADALLSLTLPFWGWAALLGWVFGDAACKVVSMALELSFYSSILLLVCISADRYRLVVHPVQSRREARGRRDWVVCSTVWVAGVVLSLPALFHSAVRPVGSERTVCLDNYSSGSAAVWRLATRIMRHILGFLMPLVVMGICYGAAAARLQHLRSPRGRRARRLIAAVVGAFLLCWAPHHLSVMVDTLQRAKLVPHDCASRWAVNCAEFATQCLGLLHSLVNPVLYAFMGHRFRDGLCERLQNMGLRDSPDGLRNSRSLSRTSSGLSTAF